MFLITSYNVNSSIALRISSGKGNSNCQICRQFLQGEIKVMGKERKKNKWWDYLLIQLSAWAQVTLHLQKPHQCSQPSKHVLERSGDPWENSVLYWSLLIQSSLTRVDALLLYTVCYFKRDCILSWNTYYKHCRTDLQQIDWFYTCSWEPLRNITQYVSIFHKAFLKKPNAPKVLSLRFLTAELQNPS